MLDDDIPLDVTPCWKVEPMCDENDPNAPHGSNTDEEMDVPGEVIDHQTANGWVRVDASDIADS